MYTNELFCIHVKEVRVVTHAIGEDSVVFTVDASSPMFIGNAVVDGKPVSVRDQTCLADIRINVTKGRGVEWVKENFDVKEADITLRYLPY